MQLNQVGAGIQAELVGQLGAQGGVALQRLGRPAGPEEREHVQAAQPLAERVPGDRGGQLAGDGRVGAEGQPRLGEILDGDQSLLLEAGGDRTEEWVVGEVGRRLVRQAGPAALLRR